MGGYFLLFILSSLRHMATPLHQGGIYLVYLLAMNVTVTPL